MEGNCFPFLVFVSQNSCKHKQVLKYRVSNPCTSPPSARTPSHQQLSESRAHLSPFSYGAATREGFASGPAQLQPRASSPLCLHVMRLGICALVTSTQRLCLLVKPEVSFRNIQFPETRRQLYSRQTMFYSLSAFISSSKAQAVLYSPTHFTKSSFTSFSPRCASTRNFSSSQLNFESAAVMSW